MDQAAFRALVASSTAAAPRPVARESSSAHESAEEKAAKKQKAWKPKPKKQ
jgi:hypothetical protein